MRYYSSGQSHGKYKPKKNWRSLRKKKIVRHNDEFLESRYSNPFKNKKKRRSFSFKKFVLPFVLVSWLGLILYSPYFRISDVKYNGLKILSQNELEGVVDQNFLSSKYFIPKNNYFLVNEKKIETFLQDKYSLNSIVVRKTFPKTITIFIQEKITSAIYDNGKSYFLVDEDGVVIKLLKNEEPVSFTSTTVSVPNTTTSTAVLGLKTNVTVSSTIVSSTTTSTPQTHTPTYSQITKEFGNYPIIYDLSEKMVSEKDHVLEKGVVQGLIEFYNALERGSIVKVRYATIDDPGAGIIIYTNKPWKIYFKPENDLSEQISNLKVVLKNSNPSEYIDLRFGERIYWK